jgi:alanine racemase
VDVGQLAANARELRRVTRPEALLAPVVKADAYGHGLLLAARAFVAGGADWLCVDSLEEAATLRRAGFGLPLLVLGWVPPDALPEAVALDLRLVVYSAEALDRVSAAAAASGRTARVHLKLETGNNRQGLLPEEAAALAAHAARLPALVLEGASTHFADIEDTTDHTFAARQLSRLREVVGALRDAGHALPLVHCANSAATILWPETHFGLVRAGISAYGMWPSTATFITALTTHRAKVDLRPALTWKTRVAQLKWATPGDTVGYGRTYHVTHETRLAVLPVGYYDGYGRGLSNIAWTLVRGHRAPVRGRICMNMTMIDVTDVPDVREGDDVVLLGPQGAERVKAEQLAEWMGTINYEVTTRIGGHIPRIPAP